MSLPEKVQQLNREIGAAMELALDQVLFARPLLGWARYRTPIRNLYLCGSGVHPGTGLDGRSGAVAAREILKAIRAADS